MKQLSVESPISTRAARVTFYCERERLICREFVNALFTVPAGTNRISIKLSDTPSAQAVEVGFYFEPWTWNQREFDLDHMDIYPLTWVIEEKPADYTGHCSGDMYDLLETTVREHPRIQRFIQDENRRRKAGGKYKRRCIWLYVSICIHEERKEDEQ